jgi:hypothetical protein
MSINPNLTVFNLVQVDSTNQDTFNAVSADISFPLCGGKKLFILNKDSNILNSEIFLYDRSNVKDIKFG